MTIAALFDFVDLITSNRGIGLFLHTEEIISKLGFDNV